MTDKTDDPHTYSFTADEHLAGSIDENSAKLGERKFDELDALHTAEGKGQNRAGMLSAIDGERKARGEAADKAFEAASEAAQHAGRTLATDVEVTGLRHQLEAAQKERDAALAKASKAGKAKAPTAKAEKPRVLKVDGAGDFDGATTVAFVDTAGATKPAIADLEFGEDDFAARRDAKVLNERVDFDGTEPLNEIAAAYLLDGKGKVAGVAQFKQPITIGGGRKGTLPAGTLMFKQVPAADAAEA